MRTTFLALTGAVAIGLLGCASDVQAAQYTIEQRFHQPAASNVEEADITVINCSNGRQYYIYGYYRNRGPYYRAIIPPYWGNPVGGKDHQQFEDAIEAACY